jgi:hypothetical protein
LVKFSRESIRLWLILIQMLIKHILSSIHMFQRSYLVVSCISKMDWVIYFEKFQTYWSNRSSFLWGTEVWTQGLQLEPFHQPFCVMVLFEIGACELLVWGWPQTMIPLISASWIARITGVSFLGPKMNIPAWVLGNSAFPTVLLKNEVL